MKKEKAAVQQMNREAAQRYLADISRGLSQEQVQERIDGGWTNKMVTAESETVGQIVKGKPSNLLQLDFCHTRNSGYCGRLFSQSDLPAGSRRQPVYRYPSGNPFMSRKSWLARPAWPS